MGSHSCKFGDDNDAFFEQTLSGDVTLEFASGRTWQMPDMIVHYIADHGWQPPTEFVEDVMGLRPIRSARAQTKGVDTITKVGYLNERFISGPVSWDLVGKLVALITQASRSGNRSQMRGG